MSNSDENAEDFLEAPLPPEIFNQRLAQALTELDGPELENLHELIRWFRRRYPTPLERLRYARRKYNEALALQRALKSQLPRKDPKPA